jgi:very-short-patch-repair endonuclease
VIVELDGAQAHKTTKRFHGDRRRDRKLTAAGWKPLRITARQLDADLLSDLAALHIHRPHDPRDG